LLVFAWLERPRLFLWCFGTALATDAVDGWLARRQGQTSALGAKLDSWGDLTVCVCAPLGAWWLWSDVLRREGVFFAILLVSYAVPTLFGLVRYGRLPSYHTYLGKLAAVLMAPAALLLLSRGPAWPFRVAALVVMLEALEETAMTALLPRWTSDVSGLPRAVAIRRELLQDSDTLLDKPAT